MGGSKKEYRPRGAGREDETGNPLSVLGAAVLAFAAVPRIELLVIPYPPEAETGEADLRASLPARIREGGKPRVLLTPGGRTRRASVHRALSLLETWNPAYVLIHDGCRPWIEAPFIEKIIDAVMENGAVIPLVPLTETPKEVDREGWIRRHLQRARIGAAQTPQAFAFPAILRAHELAAEREKAGFDYTDDAEVWGQFRGPVRTIPGSPRNRKITFPEDLV
jgi:2-C-methyl-D-erythritol 4-phosphate cytidylyltransferase